jgi:hypothetical protein
LTGNCNLRCPYCINDFSEIRDNVLMTVDSFDRALRLLPLLSPEGQLLLSCYFEPTLHPGFLDFLERIPHEYRARAAFTTNLSRRLPDSFFGRTARLGFRQVNVSIDSLRPLVFEEMRKGARLEIFQQNLQRLVAAFSAHPGAPKLHLISMVSKLNLAEIPQLVERCQELYRPFSHEVRVIWLTEEMEQREWIMKEAVNLEDFLGLRRVQASFPSHVEVVYDLPRNREGRTPFPTRSEEGYTRFLHELKTPGLREVYSTPIDSILRITSEGMLYFLTEPEIILDLKKMDDPLPVVRQLLALRNLSRAGAGRLRESSDKARELRRLAVLNQWLADRSLETASPGMTLGSLDRLEEVPAERASQTGGVYRVSGWAGKQGHAGPAEEVVVIASQRRKQWALAVQQPDRERLDVVQALSNPGMLYCGWVADLNLEPLVDRLPGRFRLAAYSVDSRNRKAYPLSGALEATLGRSS